MRFWRRRRPPRGGPLRRCVRVGAIIGAVVGGLIAIAVIIALHTDLRQVIGGRPNPLLPLLVPYYALLGAGAGAIAGVAVHYVRLAALRSRQVLASRYAGARQAASERDERARLAADKRAERTRQSAYVREVDMIGNGRWQAHYRHCRNVLKAVDELARRQSESLRRDQLNRLSSALRAELPTVFRLARYGYALERRGRLNRGIGFKADQRLRAARAVFDEAARYARLLANAH